ncbi:hypothetical protein CFP56_043357 [Quercus suber]|uniref:Uncharacterized protein n=1 Tax=Quercus suber TaxID=58331 RepID=A0AAW0LKR6_QUESU
MEDVHVRIIGKVSLRKVESVGTFKQVKKESRLRINFDRIELLAVFSLLASTVGTEPDIGLPVVLDFSG